MDPMTEAEVRAFVVRYFQAVIEETDLDVFAGLFTEDGVLEDPVGTPPLRGRAAIREFVRHSKTLIARVSATVREVMVCGDESAVRWSLEVHTVHGASATLEGIGIFMFAGSGQLRHVREYHDASKFAQLFSRAPAG
jgi:steroid delta-isomerase